MTSETSRRATSFSACLFAAAVPLSIAGANISWALFAVSLAAFAYSGGTLIWKGRKSVLEKPLWAFLFVSILASALGTEPSHSFRFTNQDLHKVWIYYLFMVGLASVGKARIIPFAAAGFSVAALVGLSQALPSALGFIPDPRDGSNRAHAFVHAVTFGGQMTVAFLGGLAFALSPQNANRPRIKRLAWIFCGLTGAALVLSQTRAALLGVAAGTCSILILLPRLRKWVLIAIPLTVLCFAALEIAFPYRSIVRPLISSIRSGKTSGIQMQRLHLWHGALAMATDHPITGVGHNNFRAEFPKYIDTVFDDKRKSFGTAHNLYFHHLAERGILGLAVLFWLLGAFTLEAWRRSRDKPEAVHLWALATSVAFLVLNLTEVALQVEIFWMLVFFVWIISESKYHNRLDLEDV